MGTFKGILLAMASARPALSDAFSRTVSKYRQEKGLSRAALARLAGLHQTYVGLLERGDRTPNLDTANSIAEALGKSLPEMLIEAEKIWQAARRK